ncbi:hypothetical protein PAHA111176_02155 [Parendozoicomonas haliclonae]|uniref:Uncharacterized protein n=1 Tax=Parendozoicomonas haliclonae TaxID=1960125 RepID=A0A1X7ARW6_9GAMM|nr:hypothetical protein EHSB41UT_04798 [Parendozoicomonas haliclonae]
MTHNAHIRGAEGVPLDVLVMRGREAAELDTGVAPKLPLRTIAYARWHHVDYASFVHLISSSEVARAC